MFILYGLVSIEVFCDIRCSLRMNPVSLQGLPPNSTYLQLLLVEGKFFIVMKTIKNSIRILCGKRFVGFDLSSCFYLSSDDETPFPLPRIRRVLYQGLPTLVSQSALFLSPFCDLRILFCPEKRLRRRATVVSFLSMGVGRRLIYLRKLPLL